MDFKQVNIQTISPIYVPIELKTGVDRSSPQYQKFQALINQQLETVLLNSSDDNAEYQSITKDSWEHRLFTWSNHQQDCSIEIHVFPNNIGVAAINHQFEYQGDSDTLEKSAQDQAKRIINNIYADFYQSLASICALPHGNYFKLDAELSGDSAVFWVSRTVLVDSSALSQPLAKKLITEWLEHTHRPDDAKDILSGQLKYSLSWLNYVVVDATTNDERIDSMILAQYYYAAQENCNKLLKQAIDSAYNNSKSHDAQKMLSRSRVNTRMHQVDYHEHLKYLTRSKRKMLEDILACWNYDQLTENGQRMIEICSSKIEETNNQKRERSSLLTDLILVALSFFTVFELSLYLTELSREMMSRPTLDFNDDSPSFMLRFIAEIDTDVMFASGFILTLFLVFVYKHIKSR